MAPGREKYSLDLPRAVKNREYAMEMKCGDVLGLGMRGICNRGLIQGVNL